MLKRITTLIKATRVVNEVTRCYCESVITDAEPRRGSEKCVNQVNLIGRVGRDPEVRGTEEKSVIIFTLATNTTYPKDNEYITRTDWHRISVFHPNLVQSTAVNIRKGDRIFVNGKIRYDEYVDQRSGMKTRTCSIVANDLVNLTKKFLQDGMSHEEE